MDYKDMTVEQLDREKERLKSRYNEIEDQCVHDGLSWDEFCKKAKKEREGLYFIDKYKRLKKDPIVGEIPTPWKSSRRWSMTVSLPTMTDMGITQPKHQRAMCLSIRQI